MPKKDKKKAVAADAPEAVAAEEATAPEVAPVEAAPPVVRSYRVDAHLLASDLWGTEGDERKVVCVEATSVEEAIDIAQADLTFTPSACLVHGPEGSTLVA